MQILKYTQCTKEIEYMLINNKSIKYISYVYTGCLTYLENL